MDHKICSFEFSSDAIEAVFFDGSKKRYDIRRLCDSCPEYKLLENAEILNNGKLDKMRTHIKWDYNIVLDSDTIWSDGVLLEMVNITDPHIRLAQLLLIYRDKLSLTQKQLSERTGITQADISKLERGEGNPSLDTINRLAEKLECSFVSDFLPNAKRPPYILPSDRFVPYLKEIKRQGEYRITDMMALPEDIHAELIDGVIYDMAEPTIEHQLLISEMEYLFMDYIKKNKGNCQVLHNVSVTFKDDDCDYLVPDMTVVCGRDRYDRSGVIDEPDYVLEVVSPSCAKRDYTLKLSKYSEKGVREYWIIDPVRECVVVYCRDEDYMPHIYQVDSCISVNIYEGRLVIDMGAIFENLKHSME